jgi:hypothetical protein
MGYVKLQEPGSEHTMHVKSVSVNTSGSWPEWEFTDGTDTLAVPQKAMERQLERLKMASALEMAGSTVRFARSVKLGANKRPFWDCEIVPGAAASPPPTKRMTAAEALTPPKAAPSLGRLVAGLDYEGDGPSPDDEEARYEQFAREMDELGASGTERAAIATKRAEPPLTPREVRELDGAEAKRDAVLTMYGDLYEVVLMRLSAAHFVVNAKMTGVRATDKVALTSDTVQAATFSIFKTWRDTGLVK